MSCALVVGQSVGLEKEILSFEPDLEVTGG